MENDEKGNPYWPHHVTDDDVHLLNNHLKKFGNGLNFPLPSQSQSFNENNEGGDGWAFSRHDPEDNNGHVIFKASMTTPLDRNPMSPPWPRPNLNTNPIFPTAPLLSNPPKKEHIKPVKPGDTEHFCKGCHKFIVP